LTYPVQPTTRAQFFGNIGIEPELRTMGAEVIDPSGKRNKLKLEFSMINPQTPPGTQWNVKATTQDINDDTIIYDTKNGIANFDASGALISSTLSTIDNNGAAVSIDLGGNYTGIIAVANSAITASSSTDGVIKGDLSNYEINSKGEVIASFTNGMQSSVGKIAVYHFQNDQGLDRLSGTYFTASANSGKPIFYQDANGQNIIGTDITNFKLESSNVDMTVGLTDLIILQRTYDANSKSITTADQMIQKALNMDA
jgi:flagellar hook protein FlgE